MFKVHCTVALCILTLESLGNNTAMMQITEDTPPDMLAGAMDLTIHLPTSRTVKMSVERSTPMMDLLVQITTAHHLQHSGHILQALEMGSTSGPTDKILPYKPNTPIGSLETQHVKVVSKNRTNSVPKTSAIGQQPFESTFRLQVHLPRNQLYVIRVSQYVFLEDIMKKVCDEKNLDIRKYEFRHPGHLDEVLDPKLTLSDYQITEVYLVAKGTAGLSQTFSSNDIMALKKEEERKQLQARTGGGVFNLIFKRGKSSFGSGSVSSDTRSISPSHSDDSRSVTPPGIQQQILPVTQQQSPITEKPKPPQRKRRPAPKPPQQNLPNSKPSSQISTISDSNTSELQQKGSENGLTICHSRNSSDSSGYHEPSVLSDNCNLSLPRRTKPNIINEVVNEESQSSESNRSSTGNLSNMLKFSKSTTSIASRKKKAAPPPPSLLQSQSLVEKPSPVVASPIVEAQGESNPKTLTLHDTKCTVEISSVEETHLDGLVSPDISEQASTPDLEADEKNSLSTIPTKQSAPASISSSIASTPSHLSKTKTFTNSVIPAQNGELTSSVDRPQIKYMQNPTPPDIYPSKPTYENSGTFEYPKGNFTGPETELENEWQYQLPSPPTAFRDLSPTNMTDVTNYDTVTLEEFKGDSVITNPMLFEKLERVKDRQSEIETVSDVNSTLSEEERPMLNKLTLENLEKRKSLVYNRELSTSLKIAQNSNTNHTRSEDRVHGSHSDVINELEDIIHHGRSKTLSRHNSCADDYNAAFDRHLPNFQISTYDKPKSKINIFEDDSVRSNVEIPVKDEVPYDNLRQTSENSAVENDTFKKPQEFGKYKALTRSNFFVKNNHAPTNIMRSESFSSSNHNIYKWKPQNPVQRSKSQVALNDYKELTEDGTECLTRSNSLLDVPGLQSLEVMRMIQTKLGNSTEHIFEKEVQSTPPPLIEEDKPDSTLTTKTYRYQGPPSINLSTWSERPKTKVSLKEDKDYRSNDTFSPEKSNNVSIKVNGVETIKSTTPGNVIIKIGESESKSNTFSSRFLNHYAGVGYRKPLSNVNKIGNIGRPHSIAMDLDIDISRVPVVRSVELKKPLKEVNNKSVTQINSNELVNNIRNKFVEMPEPANKVCSTNNESCNEADSLPKPVNRINSFAQSRYGPTVVGFRSVDNDNESVRRRSWNLSNTLPSKISADHSTKTYTTNTNVPFSQVTLKRVESNKVSSGNDADTTDSRLNGKTTLYNTYSSGNIYSLESEVANTNIPPPPPTIPKITNTKRKSVKTFEPVTDPRDDLLNSIRSFGGIKGLKHVKV
ncbi:uncharacterized protein LOC116172580 isoform X5 [Photinus pyralis]|uniref:uncharacterized protein LOC116172580 isoform X5 n=1 Tax=Photinus pyralis TaxID=7054 RepID=UPI0012673266|nr:uncharacterized protein LOC116172580 isoform X5 [Photinus pyralis]